MSDYKDHEQDLKFDEGDSAGTGQVRLSNNTLALLGLANEYCAACEKAPESAEMYDFLAKILRLLPRIYITVTDTDVPSGMSYMLDDLRPALDEEMYNRIAGGISALLGENDTYLEVFKEGMRYSDTPIAASISEGLADIYQEMYDLLETVRDAPNELINEAVGVVLTNFAEYWSQTLTNVMRAVNAVRFNFTDY